MKRMWAASPDLICLWVTVQGLPMDRSMGQVDRLVLTTGQVLARCMAIVLSMYDFIGR